MPLPPIDSIRHWRPTHGRRWHVHLGDLGHCNTTGRPRSASSNRRCSRSAVGHGPDALGFGLAGQGELERAIQSLPPSDLDSTRSRRSRTTTWARRSRNSAGCTRPPRTFARRSPPIRDWPTPACTWGPIINNWATWTSRSTTTTALEVKQASAAAHRHRVVRKAQRPERGGLLRSHRTALQGQGADRFGRQQADVAGFGGAQVALGRHVQPGRFGHRRAEPLAQPLRARACAGRPSLGAGAPRRAAGRRPPPARRTALRWPRFRSRPLLTCQYGQGAGQAVQVGVAALQVPPGRARAHAEGGAGMQHPGVVEDQAVPGRQPHGELPAGWASSSAHRL